MFNKSKHVAVLGAGENGEAAARLLAEKGVRVTVLDSASAEKLRTKIEKLAPFGIQFLTGADADTNETVYDFGVLSPGIDPATPLIRNFRRKKIELIGELEMAFELCKCPVIAITGTNGKTTTTQLVERMLNACGVRTLAAGNIGPAFSAVVSKSAELDVMTLEVSSFQLEEIRAFRPRIAVWLNLTPDHLDRYKSVEEYRAAKLRVFENQTEQDFAIVNLRDELPPFKAKTITFSAYEPGGDFELRNGVIFYHGEAVLQMSNTRLRGLHNAENLMAALGVGVALGLSFEKMTPPLCDYTPLPHRCELVRTINGTDYI